MLLPLKPVLASAEITGDDRIIHCRGKPGAILFGHMGQRAIYEQVFLFVQKFRRHRGKPASVKEVHKEGLENVIAVMAQNDSRAAFFARDPVEVAAPKP